MNNMQQFLEIWNVWAIYAAIFFAALGLGIFIFHNLKIAILKQYKAKYDYINAWEIRLFWFSLISYIIAGAFYFNTLGSESVEYHGFFWFFARVFISVCLVLMAYVIFRNILDVYYPAFVAKKLKTLRYKPRTSPSGNVMKLLSEEEEDVHLDEGMQAEEDAFSVDYDVWIDEATGHTQIEKYMGHKNAEQCPDCNYYTLKVDREEVLISPSTTEPGQLMKHYKCTYCGHKERKSFNIAQLEPNVPEASPA